PVQLRHGVAQADNSDLTPRRAPADTLTPITRGTADQSNTSILFGKRLILKMFRRIESGPNPDVEIGEYLTERRFPRVPPLFGSISYLPDPKGPGLPASIAMIQEYVWNQGNAWQVTIDELGRYLERVAALPLPDDATPDTAH